MSHASSPSSSSSTPPTPVMIPFLAFECQPPVFLEDGISASVRPGLFLPKHNIDSSSPPTGFTTVYLSYFLAGFREHLASLMVYYCSLVQHAPAQLDLTA